MFGQNNRNTLHDYTIQYNNVVNKLYLYVSGGQSLNSEDCVIERFVRDFFIPLILLCPKLAVRASVCACVCVFVNE